MHPVLTAMEARRRDSYQLFVKEYIYTDAVMKIIDRAESLQIPHSRVSEVVLNTLSGARPHQGVCMDVSKLPVASTVDITRDLNFSKFPPVWLLPYMVQDPMNLGAILRSAYFLGAEKIILPEKNSCSLSPVVSKASAGALEVIDIAMSRDDESLFLLLQNWKNVGGCVVGAVSSGKDSIPVRKYTADRPTLLIVGNEGTGLVESIVAQCDVLVSIDSSELRTSRHESVDSLNVSVATGILLHSILQQHYGGDGRGGG